MEKENHIPCATRLSRAGSEKCTRGLWLTDDIRVSSTGCDRGGIWAEKVLLAKFRPFELSFHTSYNTFEGIKELPFYMNLLDKVKYLLFSTSFLGVFHSCEEILG